MQAMNLNAMQLHRLKNHLDNFRKKVKFVNDDAIVKWGMVGHCLDAIGLRVEEGPQTSGQQIFNKFIQRNEFAPAMHKIISISISEGRSQLIKSYKRMLANHGETGNCRFFFWMVAFECFADNC